MNSDRWCREDYKCRFEKRFLFYSFATFRASLLQGEAADCHLLLRMSLQLVGILKVPL